MSVLFLERFLEFLWRFVKKEMMELAKNLNIADFFNLIPTSRRICMSNERASTSSIKVNGYEIPTDLLYSKEHEWVRVEKDRNARIGITDYAQKSLHEVVYVELPEEGATAEQMKPIGTVESIKAVSEVYSPLSGKIIRINERLMDSPELVNVSPYDEGWIAVIKPLDLEKEVENLMTPKQYGRFIEQLIKK